MWQYLVFIILLLIIYHRSVFTKPAGFPPGPPSLPIWGSYWFILLLNYTYTYKALMTLHKWYKTKVLGMYLGPFKAICLSDYESLKEALRKPEFQGRPDVFVARERSFNKRLGIFFIDGDDWLEQRRFMLRNMRDLGYARRFSRQEEIVKQQIQDLINALRGEKVKGYEELFQNGQAFCPYIFAISTVNSLWALFTGDVFSPDKYKNIVKLTKSSVSVTQSFDGTGGAICYTPWLRHIAPEFFRFKFLYKGLEGMHEFVAEELKKHYESFDEESERGYLDIYFKEAKKRLGVEKSTSFTDEQIHMMANDLSLPASNALPHSVAFALLCFIYFPDVLKKIQQEIDKVVGRGRLPTLDDRFSLPYLEAFQREVWRMQTIAPLGVPHSATEDTYFQGHFIPKNTVIVTNLWAAHNDPDVWDEPHVCRPERFLEDDVKTLRKDLTLPFGAGRRLCAGETFSRHMFYFILSALVQNFNFKVPEGKTVPGLDDHLPGLSLAVKDFWLQVTPRE